MGFGTAVLDSAQHKLFYHWFGYSGLAMAFGLESAVAKTVSLVAGMTSIPIVNSTGWYGWCFWIPVAFCAFSLGVNVLYVFFERRVIPKHLQLTPARVAAMAGVSPKKQKLSFDTIWLLPWVSPYLLSLPEALADCLSLFQAFWMLPMVR
ncbi:hypothetical protein BDY24DRAFT_403041 [Mrakia frigida]|uniref:uncharacterized protein n=1 Tax=Mrakia frigida TaxID=29902 RepID=UPI003FCBFAE7